MNSSRVLTSVEQILSNYCGSEAQGVLLAKVVSLPENPSERELENAVILALVRAKEACSGPVQIEFLGGCRRDTVRQLCS